MRSARRWAKGPLLWQEKVAVATSRDKDVLEFIVVEGDSAGGSAKQARDRRFQAIMPSKGKIMNTEKQKLENVLGSEELRLFNTAIGTGTLTSFKLEDVKYGKIIIMSDADVDGYHIRTLWLTYIYRYMRPLIHKRHALSCPAAPLQGLQDRKEGHDVQRYAYSDEELDAAKKEIGSGFNIQRFKGPRRDESGPAVGDDLKPGGRGTLLRVTIDDAARAERMVSASHGRRGGTA